MRSYDAIDPRYTNSFVKSTNKPSSNQILSISVHRSYSLSHLIFLALSDSRFCACFWGEIGIIERLGA
jgi:hypothetical protein